MCFHPNVHLQAFKMTLSSHYSLLFTYIVRTMYVQCMCSKDWFMYIHVHCMCTTCTCTCIFMCTLYIWTTYFPHSSVTNEFSAHFNETFGIEIIQWPKSIKLQVQCTYSIVHVHVYMYILLHCVHVIYLKATINCSN